MKKLVLCIALILVFATAICAVSVTLNPTDKKDPNDVTGLNNAKEYLSTMLKNASLSTGADFTRPAVLKNKEGSYTVEWKLTVTSGPAEGITLGAIENGLLSIDVDEFSPEEIVYTLTATIIDENGNTETLTFNHKVPAFKINTYEEYIAGCIAGSKEEVFTVKGYVIGISAKPGGSSAGSIWLVDEDGNGYYAYKPTLSDEVLETRESMNAAFPRGTEIVVKGTVTKYGGCYEFNKDCEIIYTGKSVDPATLPYVDRTELFGSAKNMQDAETLDAVQSTRATLKGVILGAIPEEGDYNYHFTVNGVDFIFYSNLYLLDEEENQAVVDAWEPGAKANLTGVINVYSSNFQLYPDSVDSIEIVNEVLTDAEKVERQKGLISLSERYSENFVLPEATIADTSIEWSVEGTGAVIGEGNAVTITQASAEQTVTFTATITSGSASDTATYTVTIPAARTSFIKAALNAGAALASGSTTEDSYMIIGTVSRISEAYSEQYKNVTFYVIDAEGNELMIYRYKGDNAATIAVGDSIAFAAPIKNYNGTIEAVAPFVALNVTDLKTAADAGIAGTGVADTVIYGYVKNIKTVYNDQYDNITVTLSDGTNDLDCYRLKGGSDLAVGDYILVTGTPSAYNNAAQMAQGATYTKSAIYTAPEVEEPAAPITTIEGALAASEGASVELTGTVSEIYEAWSSYNNMSFYITDGTNSILVFRTNTQVELGNTVSVVGTITIYSQVAQVAQGSTVTITGSEGGETPNPGEGEGEPETPSAITTIAGAIAGAEGAAVELSGTVSSIYEAWSSYNNMSFYITDGTNSILVFRTNTQVGLGDVVSVSGTITIYYEKAQIAQGSTTTITTAHVCSTYTDATCLTAAKCTVCEKENGLPLGHTEPNAEGNCDRCGTPLTVATTTVSASIADLITSEGWTSSTTKQSFSLDSVVSVKVDGGANSGKAYNGNHIRIYATDSPAGSLTISVADGYELVSVKISCQTGTYAFLYVGEDTTTDISNVKTTVSGSSVVLNAVKNGTDGKQVRVTAIEVEYAPVQA